MTRETIWNEEFVHDQAGYARLHQYGIDLHKRDHDEKGERLPGTERLRPKNTYEYKGTWCRGPYADKPLPLKIKEFFEHYVLGKKYPKIVDPLLQGRRVTWGTREYSNPYTTPDKDKVCDGVVFDYAFLLPENGDEKGENVQSNTEYLMVQPTNSFGGEKTSAQSMSTDHLGIGIRLRIKAINSSAESILKSHSGDESKSSADQ